MIPNNFKILVNTDKSIATQDEIFDVVYKSLEFNSENIYAYDMSNLYVSVKISNKSANQKFDEITRNIGEFFENDKENKCVVFTNVNFSVESINRYFTEILKNSTRNIVVIGKNCIRIDKEIKVISCGKSSRHFRTNFKKLKKKLVTVEVNTKNEIIYLGGIDKEKIELITSNLICLPKTNCFYFDLNEHVSEKGLIKMEDKFINIHNTKDDKQNIVLFSVLYYDKPIMHRFVELFEMYSKLIGGRFLFLFSDSATMERFIDVIIPNEIHGLQNINNENISDKIYNILFGIETQIKQPSQQENNTVNQSNDNQIETYSQDCLILHKVDKLDSLFGIELAKTKASENIGKRFFNYTEEYFGRNSYEILFDLFSSEENPIILCIENVHRHEKYLDMIHNYQSLFSNIQVVLIMDEDVMVYVDDRFASPTVKSILLDLSKIEFNENFFIEKCNKIKKFAEKEISNINIVMCKDFDTFDWYYEDVLSNLRKQPNTLLFEFDFTKKLHKTSLAKSVSEINNFQTKQEKIIVFSSTKTLGHDKYVDDLVSVLKNDADTKIIIVDMISEFNGRLLTKLGLEVDKFIQTNKEVITLEDTIPQQNNTDNQHKADTFIQKHKPKTKATPYFSDGKMENVLYVEYHPEFKPKIVIGTKTNFGNITNFKYEKSTRTTYLTLENKSDVTVMDVDSDDLKFFPYQILTEDLHAKYEYDEAYFVNKDFKSFPYKETINDFYSSENIKNKITFFHSEDKAKEYSNLNMPLFSMQEMLDLFCNVKNSSKKLKKAYKKKIEIKLHVMLFL